MDPVVSLNSALKQLDAAIALQAKKMLNEAKSLYPQIVEDDLWQPFDFPLLEESPHFRHEEGIREGLLSAKATLQAIAQEEPFS